MHPTHCGRQPRRSTPSSTLRVIAWSASRTLAATPGPVGELRDAACGGRARVIQLRPPNSLLAILGRISRLGLQDTPVLWGNRGAFFG
jgi:hypothetical protein